MKAALAIAMAVRSPSYGSTRPLLMNLMVGYPLTCSAKRRMGNLSLDAQIVYLSYQQLYRTEQCMVQLRLYNNNQISKTGVSKTGESPICTR